MYLLSEKEVHRQVLHTEVVLQLTQNERSQGVETWNLGDRTREGRDTTAKVGLTVCVNVPVCRPGKSAGNDREVIGSIVWLGIAIHGRSLSGLTFSKPSSKPLICSVTWQAW